jgi:hypothetical protein
MEVLWASVFVQVPPHVLQKLSMLVDSSSSACVGSGRSSKISPGEVRGDSGADV